VRREVERLSATDRQIVDLAQMLGEVVACVRPLASRCQIALEWTPASTEKLYVAVHRVMLRQAILNLLSHIIRTHQGKALPITLWRAGAQAMVRISYCAEMPTKSLEPDQPLGVATELLSSLDVAWEVLDVGGGIVHISISIPLAAQRTLLIIDDHQGLVRLFERYLEGQPYRVYSATEWDKALSLVEEIYPDIIILDVMMPDRDGWEVLQMLRQRPQGAQARVIVCSIINDPQLAAALGADGFLHKPVDRATLLHMLEAVAGSSLCT
ncbi:MAG: hybrid sensor histidine kinase/response regulator, partial [Chloroflexi bacterium]|nr:hybrid sensor histidine kinase/response regulator [Chloroflexota bacterium]